MANVIYSLSDKDTTAHRTNFIAVWLPILEYLPQQKKKLYTLMKHILKLPIRYVIVSNIYTAYELYLFYCLYVFLK